MILPSPLFFDNDGVLFDSEKAFFSITQMVFTRYGLDLPPSVWARCFLGLGQRTYEIAMQLGLDEPTAHHMAQERDALWKVRLQSPIETIPGIESLLHTLRSQGHRMAIVTGAPRSHFEGLHQHTRLLDFFDLSITYDECPQVKPQPHAYLMAAQRMGVNPAQGVAIEDSPRGVQAALGAGMRCALLTHPLTDLSLCPTPTWQATHVKQLQTLALQQW